MPLCNPPSLLQTEFLELTSDVSSTPTPYSYENLLSQAITTGGFGAVEVHFSSSCSNTYNFFEGGAITFRLTVDGTQVAEVMVYYVDGNTQSASIRFKTGVLTAASHTFEIDWARQVGTIRCRPASTIIEHASILLKEVSC